MILYTFGSAWGSVDLSPFCVKLQTWLRMAGVPYEARVGDVRKMPKRKLPTVELDGRLVGDSGLVIDLMRQRYNDPLGDDTESRATRAQARALRALVESELYFATAWFRWAGPDFERLYAPEIAAYARRMGVPGLLAPLAVRGARRDVLLQFKAQGMGRHTPEEIGLIGIECLSALADYLADKPFMLGTEPRSLDATVFAILHCLLVPPFESPLKDFALSRANLVAYHERMLARWWPELVAPGQRAAAA
jgi:glutathione S-transferase